MTRSLHSAFSIQLVLPLTVLLTITALSGCVHDVIHQPVIAPPPTPQDVGYWTQQLKLNSKATDVERRADNVHATIEFSEAGTLLDSCSKPHAVDRPCQLQFAESFIRAARQKTDKQDSQAASLVVIIFMHGNLNNASEDVDNYPHFRELLNCLNLGSQAYAIKYPQPYTWKNRSGQLVQYKEPFSCDHVQAPNSVRYVGIYLGWRGLTNRLKANVREGAARRITRGQGVREALIGLRLAAKDSTTAKPARLIIAGHSFGGLIIERTMMQLYTEAYTAPNPVKVDCNAADGPTKGLPPFADFVITINEAVNSISAKHFIEDVLKPNSGQFCRSDVLSSAMQRPIMIALESKSDFWSAGLGTYLRHIAGPDDSGPGDFKDSTAYPDGRPSKLKASLLIPPNNPYFQNLCFLQPGYTPGDPICDLQTVENQFSGQDGLVVKRVESQVTETRRAAGVPSASAMPNDTLNPLDHLYVRRGCRPPGTTVQAKDDPRPDCTGTRYYDDPAQLHVWNDTPYWIGAIDINVINGHNDFWNSSFVGLLSGMANAFSPLKLNQLTP